MTEAEGIILGALITATVAVVGLWIDHRRALQRRALEAALDFVGRQLSDLYAPLYSEVDRYKHALQHYGKVTGLRSWANIGETALEESDAADWYYWISNVVIPIHDRIGHLLSTKADLIEGSEWPESFEAFRFHRHSWQFNYERLAHEGAPSLEQIVDLSQRLNRAPWPSAFTSEVTDTFSRLKKRQSIYLDERSLPRGARAA